MKAHLRKTHWQTAWLKLVAKSQLRAPPRPFARGCASGTKPQPQAAIASLLSRRQFVAALNADGPNRVWQEKALLSTARLAAKGGRLALFDRHYRLPLVSAAGHVASMSRFEITPLNAS